MSKFKIDRKITIDAGHRVMHHGSKCRNIHGHTYEIHVICDGELNDGEQTGMVLDFGFCKEEMMLEIDAYCDHGFIASWQDYEVLKMFEPKDYDGDDWICDLQKHKDKYGAVLTNNTKLKTKLYIIEEIPTAENLAKHWFKRLQPKVLLRTKGLANITEIIVHETPNCKASYSE